MELDKAIMNTNLVFMDRLQKLTGLDHYYTLSHDDFKNMNLLSVSWYLKRTNINSDIKGDI